MKHQNNNHDFLADSEMFFSHWDLARATSSWCQFFYDHSVYLKICINCWRFFSKVLKLSMEVIMSTINESDRNAYCKILLTLLRLLSQQTFTSSKSTAETLEKDVKHVLNQQKNTRTTSGILIVNFEHISYFFLVRLCWLWTSKC